MIVHLYEERGADLVRELEGMFAFALWDSKEGNAAARARSPGHQAAVHRAASRRSAVRLGDEVAARDGSRSARTSTGRRLINSSPTHSFRRHGPSIGPSRKVPPGTTVTMAPRESLSTRTYWEVPDPKSSRTPAEWVARVEAGLLRAVESHLVSDVPVGAFLSGGIDSGLMVAMMAAVTDRPVETFTVGFADAGSSFMDERVYARMIAQRYRLNHHEINVEPHVADIIETSLQPLTSRLPTIR